MHRAQGARISSCFCASMHACMSSLMYIKGASSATSVCIVSQAELKNSVCAVFNIAPTGVNIQPQGASISPNLIVIGPYDTTVAGQVLIPQKSPPRSL